MKKILAVMLSIMILVSTITLVTEASEVLTPVSIYAGARTITVEYDTDEITDENIGEIIITKQNGTPVEFTTKINDEFLTIIAKEEFVRDTEDYYLQIAGTKKLFTVKTLFKPEFVADTTGNKVSGLAITRGNGVVVDVVDKNTIIAGVNEGSIGLDFDDIKNYENASIVADVYYTGDGNSKPNAAFVYNNSSKAPAYAFTYKGAGSTARAYWLLRETHGRYYNRNVMVTDGSGMKDFPGYDTPINPVTVMTDNDTKISIVQNNYGSAFSSNTITVGTTSLPADFETNANKYHYVIDKMGAVGTLMMNDTFVDIMDSQDYYDAYNEANGASLNAPTKGYFLISPLTSNFRMILSNVSVITSSIRDLATGTISVESVSTSGTELTVKFTSEGNSIDVSAVKNISDFISLSEGDYDVVSAEGDTLVLKVKEVSYEPSVITIKKNFGYDDLKVEEDINVDYIFNARFGDLSIDTIKGTDSAVVLNFSHDMTDIKISNVKEKIKLSLSGTQVNYTPVIDGESIALDLGTSIKRDVVYDLVVEEGLGYEKVTLKDTVRKYLIMETLVNATFDGGMSDDYISVSRNNECTTEETIPNTTVRNGKLYVEETDWMTVYFDKFGLENHEDYVLKFDMEHYKAAANDNFWINVPKTASGIAHYGANLKGIGWRIKSGEWVKLMQWGPARTGQKGLYEKKTNPGGPVGGFSTDMFDIAGNDGDVTLPASQPVVTSYIIEKEGTKAKLFVNGTLVDNLDMNAMLTGWNSDNPDNKITDTVPEKGVLVYSAAHSTGKNGKIASGVAFEGFEASVLKEYTDGGIKIVEEEKTITGKNASGNVKVRNFATDAENIVVLVSAYGENNKFLGSEKVINTQLNPGQMAEANFVFSASEEIKEIRTDVLYNKLETADITVDTMLQTVFESNIITVKGKTDKNEKDRNVFLMFVKDDVFNKSWTSLSETDGNIHIIPLKANENNFEYSFSFKDDGTDYAKMSLYKLVWNENGLDYEKLETYHYAKNSYVESYIEKVKDTKTTPEEFEKYAQSLCIDFKFADNPSKRNVVAESIYNLRSEISDKESFIYVVDTAKARILLLSEIKDNSATTASVNTVLTKYETNARLDLTAYKALNEAQKVKVCVNFIGADYEVKGYDQFVTDFALAVKEAKQPQPPAGGGGGGGGSVGGGAVGGLPMNVTETPAKDAVEITGTKQGFADMDEYDWAKDAVNALAEEGVITGIGNKMFNPEGVVTREQIAKMIVSVLNELDNTLVSEYSDVDKSGWAVNFIASAKKAGIMQGVSETEFAPLAPVTREDLAVILYRATLKKDKKYEARKTDFTDKAEIADYAKEAVEFMAGVGIINGFEDGSFNPKAPATRAQAAVLIYNALRKGE